MSCAGEQPIPIRPDMLLSRRVDFERRMRRVPRVTVSIIAALVVVFLLEVATDALNSAEALVEAGALSRSLVVAGEYWRTLSATFLHGSPDHLVGNAVALFILGMICEHAFGARQFVVLYIASALGGSLVSLLASEGPSVGASGAIFGLQGAAIMLFYRYRDELLVRDKRIGVVLLVWAALSITGGLVTPYIDNGAHIGGALTGMLLAGRFHPVVLNRPVPSGYVSVVRASFWTCLVALAYAVYAWL